MAKKKTAKVAKRKVKRTAKRSRATSHGPRATGKIPAEQGKGPKRTDVGYGKPPVEHQFAPGQSGNPAGAPKAKANLWRFFCRFLAMTPAELTRAVKDKELSMAQRAAIKQVQQLVKKGLAGTAWLATKEAWDRDEGKATQRVEMQTADILSPEECDEIRRAMKKGGV